MATLNINRGTTYHRTGTVSVDGEPTTLVGATVRFTIKTTEWDTSTDDSTALVTKNVSSGDADGNYTITLNPDDTKSIDPGKYFYDIRVEFPGGSIYKIDEGKIKLDGSATNRTS
jgi:hypothetical protein